MTYQDRNTMGSQSKRPLYVDLDGSLIRGDTFAEAILALLKENPFSLFMIIGWLFQGRAVAKQKVAERAPINAAAHAYNQGVVAFITAQKAAGRPVFLATAASEVHARAVADHVKLFDDVLSSSASVNLKGQAKADAMIAHNKGSPDLTYLGDSAADQTIWQQVEKAVTVDVSPSLQHQLETAGKLEKSFKAQVSPGRAFLKAIRPHQWAKNILIFVPLFLSHEYSNPKLVGLSLLAFAVFSLCASGVYLLNDLLDLAADRQHATKRNRPLAAGTLPLHWGAVGAAALPFGAFALAAAALPLKFCAGLAGYYALTNLYSFYLKRRPTADVLTLAILYTARIVVGGFAISVALTSWLVGFSFFLFLSLAYLKRYIELAERGNVDGLVPGRGYGAVDTEGLFTFGVGAMYAAGVVLALYIESTLAAQVYQTPELLWSLCIFLIFWGNRIWVGARRGHIHEDPIVFAIKDRMSVIIGLCMGAVIAAARYI